MANIAIKGHATRGKEVINLLEMLGANRLGYKDTFVGFYYYIECGAICSSDEYPTYSTIFTLEEFLEKYPYKVGDTVTLDNKLCTIMWMCWECDKMYYQVQETNGMFTKKVAVDELKPYKEEKTFPPYMDYDIKATKEQETEEDKNMGEVSDGYHTFNELYEYRLLYNAGMFNEFAKQGLYDVHKSKLHSNGSIPFDNPNWFIVQAELPTGQISNHYEMKYWNLFKVPVKEKANAYDGHTPKDVAERMRKFLTPHRQYPMTYEECGVLLGCDDKIKMRIIGSFTQLINARNAYWKIAGEEMGLDKPWEPDYTNYNEERYGMYTRANEIILDAYGGGDVNTVLTFPTEEMRDIFYENFKDLIEQCKELL